MVIPGELAVPVSVATSFAGGELSATVNVPVVGGEEFPDAGGMKAATNAQAAPEAIELFAAQSPVAENPALAVMLEIFSVGEGLGSPKSGEL
jgi:hypothetical protein